MSAPPATPLAAEAPAATSRSLDFILLAAALVLPVLAAARLAPPTLRPWIAGWIALASLITYFVFARDKSRAQRGAQRTPEAVLHGWSLAGGWPGAWLAMRRLRHKTSKFRFQLVHCLVVMLYNYAALEVLLGGRLSRTALRGFRGWFAAATT